MFGWTEAVVDDNKALKEALRNLIFAASSRDNTQGCPINLIAARQELQQALLKARQVLNDAESREV